MTCLYQMFQVSKEGSTVSGPGQRYYYYCMKLQLFLCCDLRGTHTCVTIVCLLAQ